MDQELLFYEDINDALKEAVRALGGSKVVGAKLWPEKAPEAAGRLLNDCLNDNRPEKLSPEQVMWILREAKKRGFHGLMDFIGAETGYKAVPIDPEDEKAQIKREFANAVRSLGRMTARLEQLGEPVQLRSA